MVENLNGKSDGERPWERLSNTPELDTWEADAIPSSFGMNWQGADEGSSPGVWNTGASGHDLSEPSCINPQRLIAGAAGTDNPPQVVLDHTSVAGESLLPLQYPESQPSATDEDDSIFSSTDADGSVERKFKLLPMPKLGKHEFAIGNRFYCPWSVWKPHEEICFESFDTADARSSRERTIFVDTRKGNISKSIELQRFQG
ncbi:hypothetical protein J7T55_007472 [Diaporthe amygdali]|uniref:uncharacterized protein n=1 Tax=Phomopsis amygdali TaxID=1214568 RepID=UPI0022FF30AB|nr:uncharacterized protein J7T55_007472 [Diaporthe amygdali]KAJ0116492.1 hypothetical protein J7T55_007472 [Diaporthe amygdali]